MPTVSELVIDGLIAAGVERLFWVEGSHCPPDLLAAASGRGLALAPCHHESAACIMAAVTGELTGRPGAVLAAEAGVTSGASGLAHAWLDRGPLILLTHGRPASAPPPARAGAVHIAMLRSILKDSITVGPEAASHWVAHAVHLALKDPRGPVHLHLPAELTSRRGVPAAVRFTPLPSPAPSAEALDEAGRMIARARRPVVVAGLQARASDARWLRAFCEAMPVPVLVTLKGKGVLPDPHPLNLGRFIGGVPEDPVLRRADLIIAFGLDPEELNGRPWPSATPAVAITRCAWGDPTVLGEGAIGIGFTTQVVGDLGAILEELAPRIRAGTDTDWDVGEVERLRRARRPAPGASGPRMTPQRVVQVSRECTPAGTTAAFDPDIVTLGASDAWEATEPGELLASNGLAAPGFGLPAALAAQLVYPDRRVLCFMGRDGLMRTLGDLDTAVRLQLPIVVLLFAAGQTEPNLPGASGVGPAADPGVERDLTAVARVLGLEVRAAEDEAGLVGALASALSVLRPTLVTVRIEGADHGPSVDPRPSEVPRLGGLPGRV
jgi:acetolactate synthase-1/2/3 large subunit